MKENKEPKKKFIERKVRHDNSVELIVTETPMKTWWGKLIIVLILAGMVLLPVILLIISIIDAGANG